MRRLAVVGVAAALVLAGCGEGSGGQGDDDTIRILQLAPYQSQNVSLPFMQTSAEAAVAAVNDAGGINGKKLELIACNEKYDPNESVKCAQEAVREKAAAVVGSLSSAGGQVGPILEAGQIANVGLNPNQPPDAQSKASFLLDSGVPGYAAISVAAARFGNAKKVVATMGDNSNVPFNLKYLQTGADIAGVTIAGNVVIPADAVDYSLYAQRMQDSGADAIVAIPSGPDQVVKIYNGLKAIDADIKIVSSANSFPQTAIDEAGPIANGTLLINGVPSADGSNEWGKQYVAEMTKYEPDEKVIGTVGLRSWAAVHLFAEVARTIDGPVDSKSVWSAFNQTSCLDFMWLKCLNYTEPGPLKDYPRVPSAAGVVFLAEVVDGKIQAKPSFNAYG